MIERPVDLNRGNGFWLGQFSAMASPCEILMAVNDEATARNLVNIAAHEAWRIEQKFSRYRDDGIVPKINSGTGNPIRVDAETAQLLDFAYQCFQLSDGLFDISSGILRSVWTFDGGGRLPSQHDVEAVLPFVGLEKASWDAPYFSLPAGMQIDFGGIGKEYAVDRTLQLLEQECSAPLLVNFGGDIATNYCPENQPWLIGVENPMDQTSAAELLEVRSGGLATSGSSQRFLVHEGRRYSHVLNPLTGWPVENPPLSVTVAAANCTLAGMLATYAMLQGADAEGYLEEQEVKFWAVR